jgi:hypothetical protein
MSKTLDFVQEQLSKHLATLDRVNLSDPLAGSYLMDAHHSLDDAIESIRAALDIEENGPGGVTS